MATSTSSSAANVLVLIGSGPGIGVATASLFAAQSPQVFSSIALVSRDATRLGIDRESILAASSHAIKVRTFSQDITDSPGFERTLKEVEKMGTVSCVLFNAARVEPSDLFEFPDEELMRDFKTTNVALRTAARWAIPLLSKLQASERPCFFVTSSLLWADPIPQMFALSLTKAAQRNLVMSLQKMYGEKVHIALLNVGGQVTETSEWFSPKIVADKYWELYCQQRDAWKGELSVLGV